MKMAEEERKKILEKVPERELKKFKDKTSEDSKISLTKFTKFNADILEAFDNSLQQECSKSGLKVWRITLESSDKEKNAKFDDIIKEIEDNLQILEISGEMRRKIMNHSVGFDEVFDELYKSFKIDIIPAFNKEIKAIIAEKQERKSLKHRWCDCCSLF